MAAGPNTLVIAAGPVYVKPGYLPRRIVLRASYNAEGTKVDEFIVHTQCLQENGKFSYDGGNYFPVRHENAYDQAFARFVGRTKSLDELCTASGGLASADVQAKFAVAFNV